MKKYISLLLVLVMLLSLMVGCGNQNNDPVQSNDSAQSATPNTPDTGNTGNNTENPPPASTTRTDLNMATSESMDGCDPHFNTKTANGTAIGLIYEGLVSTDKKLNVTPNLAESYEILEGGLVYEYKLKQGVKFHNGDEMKASDVVFSITRAQGSPTMYSIVGLIAGVEAVDEYTVRMTLVMPYAPFYHLIAKVPIVSERACTEAGDDFATKPCGTGAYTIGEWTAEKVTFVLNENYHGELPKIETINIATVSDSTTSLMAFEGGDLDYVGVPKADWDRIVSSGKYGTVQVSSSNTTYITFNTEVAPFDDVRVRQAIAYAINKDELVLGALEGFGTVAHTLGNPEFTLGLPSADEITTYEQNAEKAKQLLADAGYADGLDIGNMTVMAMFSVPAEIIKSQLAAVGINVEIQLAEQSAFVADLVSGNYGIGIMGVTLGTDMAEHEMAYSSAGVNQLNLSRYSDARVDELFGLAMVEPDQAKRNEYYKEAVNIFAESAAYIPLYYADSCIAMDPALVMDINESVYTWYWAAE